MFFLKYGKLIGAPEGAIEQLRKAFEVAGWQGFLQKRLEGLEKRSKGGEIRPFEFVDLYLDLGRKEEAFAWLEKTFAAHDPAVLQFNIDPAFESLRSDPRYARLVERIGLQTRSAR